MKIAIIGLGLIGGSLAKALKKFTQHQVAGCDIDPAVMQAALAAGAVDTVCTETPPAELYFLAMPPSAMVRYISENAKRMSAGAIVTDVCGVKQAVTKKCEAVCSQHALRFVGGHPMAGREVSGFESAVADLFVGRSYIFASTPKTDKAALETLERLVLQLGISSVTHTTPENHDRMIAFTSQLPHILAGAYMKSPVSRLHNGYSAGSYHDVSRVSSVDERLWSELFMENRENLAGELETLIGHLNEYKAAVEAGDRDKLFALVRESRLLKEKDRQQNGSETPHKFG